MRDTELKVVPLIRKTEYDFERFFKITIGGKWEEVEWLLQENSVVEDECKHCRRLLMEPLHEWDKFICPRVIIGTNEGGYNTTGICFDCVVEAVEKLNKGEIQEPENLKY